MFALLKNIATVTLIKTCKFPPSQILKKGRLGQVQDDLVFRTYGDFTKPTFKAPKFEKFNFLRKLAGSRLNEHELMSPTSCNKFITKVRILAY